MDSSTSRIRRLRHGSSAIARGFTLLEVMLAIMLLALLLAGTYGAIRTATKAMHSGEAAIDRTNRLRVAEEFLRRQISRIMPLAFGQDKTTNANLVFDGSRNSMRFVAPMPGYLSKGGAYVQTLTFAGNRRGGKQLLFADQMLNGFDMDEKSTDSEPSILLDQIADGRFQYRTLDENGEMTDWSDEWDDPTTTPVMVRVVVDMLPEARVQFPEMEIPLMLDVGAARPQQNGQQPGLGGPLGLRASGLGGGKR
ncbi:MAG: prepilin-type N-terminal cleavage/methylation domain-containing protein [Dokdonella sp.]|uniref:prepilin-type N-terminal cleavage/methylation domain-containing protein n=1 Tax=Dokdonella sp. TaxID=2291710 RepID=UPI003267F64C